MRNGYIKNLEYKIFTSFGKRCVTVDYDRSGEHNHTTYTNIPDNVRDEKSVRNFLNN